jgi:hypothetical protein
MVDGHNMTATRDTYGDDIAKPRVNGHNIAVAARICESVTRARVDGHGITSVRYICDDVAEAKVDDHRTSLARIDTHSITIDAIMSRIDAHTIVDM